MSNATAQRRSLAAFASRGALQASAARRAFVATARRSTVAAIAARQVLAASARRPELAAFALSEKRIAVPTADFNLTYGTFNNTFDADSGPFVTAPVTFTIPNCNFAPTSADGQLLFDTGNNLARVDARWGAIPIPTNPFIREVLNLRAGGLIGFFPTLNVSYQLNINSVTNQADFKLDVAIDPTTGRMQIRVDDVTLFDGTSSSGALSFAPSRWAIGTPVVNYGVTAPVGPTQSSPLQVQFGVGPI